MMEKKEICPICKKEIGAMGEAGRGRFCSVRCRQVDLGKWLEGGYRVPVSDADNDSEGVGGEGGGSEGGGSEGGGDDGGGDAA